MKNEVKKSTQAPKYNPFGKTQPVKSPMLILQESFGIGIRNFDRGADQWDATRVDDKGKPAPGWVHVPRVELECVIEFAVNEGKGTGRQCIPASEFVAYVNSLRQIVDSDFAEVAASDRTEYIPTPVVASQSFRLVRPRIQVTGTDGKASTVEDKNAARDVVSVRCTSGKGAKPMLASKEDFKQVVAALEGIASNLSSYEDQAWANYKAQVAAGEVPDVTTEDSDESEVELDLDEDVDSDE